MADKNQGKSEEELKQELLDAIEKLREANKGGKKDEDKK